MVLPDGKEKAVKREFSSLSQWADVIHGISQGSGLGLPFQVLINNFRIQRSISRQLGYRKYTKLDIRKTKIKIIGTRRFISTIKLGILHRINIVKHPIPFVSSGRNLHIMMTNDLKWDGLRDKHL